MKLKKLVGIKVKNYEVQKGRYKDLKKKTIGMVKRKKRIVVYCGLEPKGKEKLGER